MVKKMSENSLKKLLADIQKPKEVKPAKDNKMGGYNYTILPMYLTNNDSSDSSGSVSSDGGGGSD